MAIQYTEEQQNQLNFQKAQIEVNTLHDKARNRLEALRIIKDVMVENQRATPVENREEISLDKLIEGADSLINFIHNPDDFK